MLLLLTTRLHWQNGNFTSQIIVNIIISFKMEKKKLNKNLSIHPDQFKTIFYSNCKLILVVIFSADTAPMVGIVFRSYIVYCVVCIVPRFFTCFRLHTRLFSDQMALQFSTFQSRFFSDTHELPTVAYGGQWLHQSTENLNRVICKHYHHSALFPSFILNFTGILWTSTATYAPRPCMQ